MSGEYKEVKYLNIDNLKEKLTNILEEYIYSPQYIRLILNNKILNVFDFNNFNLKLKIVQLQKQNYYKKMDKKI